MKITSIKILLVGFLIIITLTASVSFVSNKKQDQKVVSEFGKYWGYTQKLYDGYKRVSDFLTLSDGTRLAYDVYLPTQKGIPASRCLCCSSTHLMAGHGRFSMNKAITMWLS
jgi:hypothetical protein